MRAIVLDTTLDDVNKFQNCAKGSDLIIPLVFCPFPLFHILSLAHAHAEHTHGQEMRFYYIN